MKVKGKKVVTETESIVVLDAGMAPPGGIPVCCFGTFQIFR